MRGIRVSIVRFVDAHQPGWVECRLVDAAGEHHVFIEKVPIVSSEELWTDTLYPRSGVIACTVIAEHTDDPETLIADTEQPFGVTSTAGRSRFVVLRQDLVEI